MGSTTSDAVLKSADEQKACGYSQLSLGKRHLLVSDIPEAVSTLALASELLAKQFGETHAECAEAYFYYGKSLLEMSRLESGILGNALEGVPEGGDLADDSQIESHEKMTKDEMTEVEAKVERLWKTFLSLLLTRRRNLQPPLRTSPWKMRRSSWTGGSVRPTFTLGRCPWRTKTIPRLLRI